MKKPTRAPPEPSRRVVLCQGVLGLTAMGLGCGDPKTSVDTAPQPADTTPQTTPSTTSTEPFDPCSVEPMPDDSGWSPISLKEYPELAEVEGSVNLTLAGQPIVVAQIDPGCFVALSSVCTHEGCTVAYQTRRFVCPCHAATFGLDGRVQGGPTNVPLTSYPAAEENGMVWVALG